MEIDSSTDRIDRELNSVELLHRQFNELKDSGALEAIFSINHEHLELRTSEGGILLVTKPLLSIETPDYPEVSKFIHTERDFLKKFDDLAVYKNDKNGMAVGIVFDEVRDIDEMTGEKLDSLDALAASISEDFEITVEYGRGELLREGEDLKVLDSKVFTADEWRSQGQPVADYLRESYKRYVSRFT